MPPSEIRKEAREALRGKWGKAIRITAAYMLVSYAIECIKKFIGEDNTFNIIINILNIIISVPLSFGLIISFIKLKRNETVRAWDFLNEGFSRFGKSWGIAWHTFLKLSIHIIIGIIIFLIIPLILSPVLLNTNTNPSLTPGLGMSGLLVVVLAIYPLIIWIFPKYLLYILSYYIAFDKPELSSKECVNKSKELMKGNRGKYFLLELSFIGWFLLITIPYGVAHYFFITLLTYNIVLTIIGLAVTFIAFILATLYLTSYIDVATVCFYDRIAKAEVEKIDEEVKVEK